MAQVIDDIGVARLADVAVRIRAAERSVFAAVAAPNAADAFDALRACGELLDESSALVQRVQVTYHAAPH